MECDAAAMGFVRGVFLREFGEGCSARVLLSNFAGVAEILLFASHGAMLAKKAALRVEDGNEWGRVFDIDVIAESGPISRSDIGGVARKCLLCDDEAKICARAGRHPITALREEAARLLGLARPIR
jgi:holo-ACP synthase CitX